MLLAHRKIWSYFSRAPQNLKRNHINAHEQFRQRNQLTWCIESIAYRITIYPFRCLFESFAEEAKITSNIHVRNARSDARRQTYFLGEFSHNGGMPIIIHMPSSILLGDETINGKLDALRFLDIAT